ncbi:MAG: hypothetical protein ABI972_07800 [Acidobacteriota bacterium]
MLSNLREFEVGPDPFGRAWKVLFVWLQTGISIRHADTVDVKFVVNDGTYSDEKVIALPHPLMLEVLAKADVPLSDLICMQVAGSHLRRMIETGEDLEKPLVTLQMADIERALSAIVTPAAH